MPAKTRPSGWNCSPQTRGCTGGCRLFSTQSPLFPADAGMYRSTEMKTITLQTVPRRRGDVPIQVVPAVWEKPCSPQTRGCTAVTCPRYHPIPLFPADAGMYREDIYVG